MKFDRRKPNFQDLIEKHVTQVKEIYNLLPLKVREGALAQLEESLALAGADAAAALQRGHGRPLAALQPGGGQGTRGARSGERRRRESDRLGAAVRTSGCQHIAVNDVEPEQGGLVIVTPTGQEKLSLSIYQD